MLTHFYPEWDDVDFERAVSEFDPLCEVIEAKDGLKPRGLIFYQRLRLSVPPSLALTSRSALPLPSGRRASIP